MKIFTRKEIIVMAMIFVVLSFSFYWFSWRPHYAKKQCIKHAEKLIRSGHYQSFNEIYDHCLLTKGMK